MHSCRGTEPEQNKKLRKDHVKVFFSSSSLALPFVQRRYRIVLPHRSCTRGGAIGQGHMSMCTVRTNQAAAGGNTTGTSLSLLHACMHAWRLVFTVGRA